MLVGWYRYLGGGLVVLERLMEVRGAWWSSRKTGGGLERLVGVRRGGCFFIMVGIFIARQNLKKKEI